MSFNEFIELVTKEQPALEDISEIMAFAEKADTEVIWEALQSISGNPRSGSST